MADDETGAVNAVRPFAFAPHDRLGIVLRLEIRVVQVLRFLEHVLAKHAVVEARRSDRAHMMKTTGGNRLPELDGVAGSFDVRLLLRLSGSLEIVDRGQMKKMVDLAGKFFCIAFAYAEILLRQVADDRDDLLLGSAPVRTELGELFLRALANQHVDRFSALQQIGDEKAADESGGAGDEVGHEVLLERGNRAYSCCAQTALSCGRRARRL